jgi:hypothetical protein
MTTYVHRDVQDMLTEVRGLSEAYDAQRCPLAVSWHPDHPCKLDAEYNKCVMWQFVVRQEWTREFVHALNVAFVREFGLTHDIRWVGLVKTVGTAEARLPAVYDKNHKSLYKSAKYHAAFLVHEEDLDQISNGHRLDLGFRWLFDVVGQGDGTEYHFPSTFVEEYAGYCPQECEKWNAAFELLCHAFDEDERMELEGGGVVTKTESELEQLWVSASDYMRDTLGLERVGGAFSKFCSVMHKIGVQMCRGASRPWEPGYNVAQFSKRQPV